MAGLTVEGEGRADGIAGDCCHGVLLDGESLEGGVMGGSTQLRSPVDLSVINLKGGRRRESIACEAEGEADVGRRRRGVGRGSICDLLANVLEEKGMGCLIEEGAGERR